MEIKQRAPIVNKVGGIVTNIPGGTVAGAKRPSEGTVKVRSPSGEVQTHTIYNARDLINHHGYIPVSRPRLVNNPANVISNDLAVGADLVDDELAATEYDVEDEEPTVEGISEELVAPVDSAVLEMAALRSAYEQKLGKKPHHKLGKAALQKAIDEAS